MCPDQLCRDPPGAQHTSPLWVDLCSFDGVATKPAVCHGISERLVRLDRNPPREREATSHAETGSSRRWWLFESHSTRELPTSVAAAQTPAPESRGKLKKSQVVPQSVAPDQPMSTGMAREATGTTPNAGAGSIVQAQPVAVTGSGPLANLPAVCSRRASALQARDKRHYKKFLRRANPYGIVAALALVQRVVTTCWPRARNLGRALAKCLKIAQRHKAAKVRPQPQPRSQSHLLPP